MPTTPRAATHNTIQSARQLLENSENPRTLTREIERMAKMAQQKPAIPTAFTFHLEPLNALVTLAMHDYFAWAAVRDSVLSATTKATWKDHTPQDRTVYMRDYMRNYRAKEK